MNVSNIKKLDLAGNSEVLDADLKEMVQLTDLNLAYNDTITSECLTNLTRLDICENEIICDVGG